MRVSFEEETLRINFKFVFLNSSNPALCNIQSALTKDESVNRLIGELQETGYHWNYAKLWLHFPLQESEAKHFTCF